jgi:Helix-turn-helix of insertion element transposase
MDVDNFNLTQLKAIVLLASGINFRQCAKTLKVNRTTLWQWRQNPEFIRAIELEKQKFVNDYRQELDNLRMKAVKQLSDYLDNPDVTMDRKIAICFDSLNLAKTIKVNYFPLE